MRRTYILYDTYVNSKTKAAVNIIFSEVNTFDETNELDRSFFTLCTKILF